MTSASKSSIPDNNNASGVFASLGVLNRKQLAVELDCHERTLRRLEDQGLPVRRVGRMRFYDIAAVRTWLMGGKQSKRRGRPPRGGSKGTGR